MRGAFGLVSLLIGIAIMAYIWSMHTAQVSKSGSEAQKQAQRLSGRGEDGKSALESITTTADNSAGHLKALLVTDIVPGGAMEKVYGLKKGDRILVVGNYPVDL